MSAPSALIYLASGDFRCTVSPLAGCAVTAFRSVGNRFGHHDWFRPADGAEGRIEPTQTSCFPLVPYSGRIAGGLLQVGDTTHRLPTGLLGDANALHGTGWMRPWTAEHVAPDQASFLLAGPDPDWPFAFLARQTFRLLPQGLEIGLAITNQDTRPMPAGIGLHPYFSGEAITLEARYDTLWQIDADKLFAEKQAVPGRWNAEAGLALFGSDLEHGFSGWDGAARLSWADRPSSLLIRASEALGHLVIYSRPYRAGGEGYVCVEPVSHCVDGFNLMAQGVQGTGTVMLEPGETLAGTVAFLVEDS